MEMNTRAVIAAEHYDRIDGRDAYRSPVKRLTLGAPLLPEHHATPIAAQVWRESGEGAPELAAELPIHQVLDLAILLSRTLLHFQDAYRLPLLYDPAQPLLDRVGLQGDALSVGVCTENPHIDADMQAFSLALGQLGELTGERLRTLSRLLADLECC